MNAITSINSLGRMIKDKVKHKSKKEYSKEVLAQSSIPIEIRVKLSEQISEARELADVDSPFLFRK